MPSSRLSLTSSDSGNVPRDEVNTDQGVALSSVPATPADDFSGRSSLEQGAFSSSPAEGARSALADLTGVSHRRPTWPEMASQELRSVRSSPNGAMNSENAAQTFSGSSCPPTSPLQSRLGIVGRRELSRSLLGLSLTPRSSASLSVATGPVSGSQRIDSDTDPARTVSTESAAVRVLWGTDLSVEEAHAKLVSFLLNFQASRRSRAVGLEATDLSPPEATLTPFYVHRLQELHETESWTLNVSMEHVLEYDEALYKRLVRYPSDMISLFDMAANQVYREMFLSDDNDSVGQIQVRVYDLGVTNSLRQLEPSHLDSLVAVRGMIVRTSGLIPDLADAFYRCMNCLHTAVVPIRHGRVQEPSSCSRCGLKSSYQLIHNRCCFTDKQIVRLQESPESVPQGETPASISLVLYEDMVDSMKPGDRVEVTGIYRAMPVRVHPRMRNVRSVFRTYLDVVHVKRTDARRVVDIPEAGDADAVLQGALLSDGATSALSEGNDTGTAPVAPGASATAPWTPAEYAPVPETSPMWRPVHNWEARIRELARDPRIYERLAASIAPSIWGMDDVKKGVLCQLFGGTRKDFASAGGTRFRSDINVLIVGDPGVSKSQLLSFVHRISPRGIYTSGRGSSAVGLTAYVTKDPETHDAVLESGALVLSDRGICCIDEFDKMSEQSRTILHEAMEQQTISIAKAGIIATLNARTSVLAAANPVESCYNPRLSVIENIQMPPTLLSRFDLVYLILDKPSADDDRRLARHIVSLFHEEKVDDTGDVGTSIDGLPLVDLRTLAAYISYAREQVHPVLSNDASDTLITGYMDMRRLGSAHVAYGVPKTITATPRQLESLIRLSEAHAKIRLSPVVERVDVEEALRLMKIATQQSATDPITGRIDLDLLQTGHSAAWRQRVNELARALWSLLQERESASPLRKQAVFHLLRQQAAQGSGASSNDTVRDDEFEEALRILQNEQKIRLIQHGTALVRCM
ncbi:hypothetical protein CCYA_CCYA03G0799 [Cyanidiococcus yangmingshanensis]|nr:hypothetical protein CCYA_CCYA03G0799 [Cyanidiococcus yangmingshanensis]